MGHQLSHSLHHLEQPEHTQRDAFQSALCIHHKRHPLESFLESQSFLNPQFGGASGDTTEDFPRGAGICLFTRSMPKRAAFPTTFGETPLASPSRVRISATVFPACCLLKASLPFNKSLTAVAPSCPAEDNSPTPVSCPEVRP